MHPCEDLGLPGMMAVEKGGHRCHTTTTDTNTHTAEVIITGITTMEVDPDEGSSVPLSSR